VELDEASSGAVVVVSVDDEDDEDMGGDDLMGGGGGAGPFPFFLRFFGTLVDVGAEDETEEEEEEEEDDDGGGGGASCNLPFPLISKKAITPQPTPSNYTPSTRPQQHHLHVHLIPLIFRTTINCQRERVSG
jgi:hypothetical protein